MNTVRRARFLGEGAAAPNDLHDFNRLGKIEGVSENQARVLLRERGDGPTPRALPITFQLQGPSDGAGLWGVSRPGDSAESQGAVMNEPEMIKGMITEARVYREQGLLAQSRSRYLDALEAVGREPRGDRRDPLRSALRRAIHDVDQELEVVETSDSAPELSREMRNLIRKLYSVSENRSIAEFKGAVALARFGQYGEALEEFNRLLERGSLAAVAAKNILTCHLAFASPDVAISQYERWIAGTQLRREELEDIRGFLEGVLENEGVHTRLPKLDDRLRRGEDLEGGDEEELPLTGMTIPWPRGEPDEPVLEFDVFLHHGSIVSIHVPPERKSILIQLSLGSRIHGMRLFSAMAVFEGNGIVIGKKRIESGPREGHYALDIHVEAV